MRTSDYVLIVVAVLAITGAIREWVYLFGRRS